MAQARPRVALPGIAVDLAGVERWLLRGAAFLIPLAVLPTTFDAFVLPKLLLARLSLVMFAAVYLLRRMHGGHATWKRTALDLPLLFFLASGILATALSINSNVALFGTYFRYEGLLTLLTYAALFWLAVQLMAGADDTPGLARSLLASAYVVSLIAITQELGGLVPGSTACGAVRPYATFGNAVALGAFLAMIAPYAISEFIAAGTWPSRLLASNLIVAIGLALVFSFTRSAWIGAAAGCAIVLIARRRELMASRARLVGLLAFAGVAAVVATMPIASGWSLGRCTAARVVSIAHPTLGSAAVRPHIWMDTVQLIASRPITGYGPDTFALVFPRFQSQDWIPGELIDKAHSDLLQVGATQGVLGIAAYLWLMVAFVRHFWRGRRTTLAWGTFAGVVGYQLAMQANFSWVPSALPFWLFLAAAVTIAVPEASATRPSEPLRRPAVWPQIAVVAGATALVMALVVRPYLADHDFKAAIDAIDAGNRPTAIATAGEARRLAPEQSIYAVEAGNLAMDLRADGRPGPAADWSAARDDFRVAIQLGTGDPVAFRGLAVAERQLDDRAQAIAAARRALELDRFDPANGSLVRALEQGA